jgi:hypothetical protein
MKAIYQSPKTDIISISLQHMIALSKLEEGQNLENAPETEETEGNLSRRRRRNQWDEWEDEEEEYY